MFLELIWGQINPFLQNYMCACVLSRFRFVQLFVTPWTVACQAPLSMGFSRLEYWSALPFPSPGDLSDPGIEPKSPALQATREAGTPKGPTFKYYHIKVRPLTYELREDTSIQSVS